MKRIILYLLLSLMVVQADAQPRRFFHATNPTVAAYDADALSFFTATGITDATQKTAINTLVLAAKSHGWWTLCTAIYPFVGGTASTHKYNLKDARDLDAAFRLSFSGGWTHSSTGALPNGTTGYADTHLDPSTYLTALNSHISYYSRTEFSSSSFNGDIGVNATNVLYMDIRNNGSIFSTSDAGTQFAYFTNGSSLGFFLSSRIANNDLTAYANGSSLGTQTTVVAGGLASYSLFIGAINTNGTATDFGQRECAFASIGDGINSTIAALMSSDVAAFQTALSR